jgi:thiamine biosynthesis lipoprotein
MSRREPASLLRRRELLVLGAGAFAVSALPFAPGERRELVRRTLPVMGTVAEIAVAESDPRRARAAIGAAFAELQRVEALMTRFRSHSDVGRANRLAFRDPVAVSPDTATVLAASLAWAESSDGAFDPCVGAAVELWDVGHRREPPSAERTRAMAGRRLYRALELERRTGGAVVRLREREARIDLGGIAKGYGVDCAVEALRAAGVRRALVNVGGDLYALGSSEDGDAWRVGVRDPDDPSRVRTTLRVADAAVATSGDYLQYFRYGGVRYHHLIDPYSGAPRRSDVHSVTVEAPTCMQADAAATAVFGMPRDRAERLLRVRAPSARLAAVI